MTDVVICESAPHSGGRMGGALAPLTAAELATAALRELVRRTGLGEGDVDDVILGNGYANGEAPAIGRIAALDAGLGTGVPGLQIDRRCGSGLQAVLYAAGAGRHRCRPPRRGRRGRVDVQRRALRARPAHRRQSRRHRTDGPPRPRPRDSRRRLAPDARRHDRDGRESAPPYGISREEQDELAVRSHHRAVAAHEAGRFADELVPVTVPGKRGKPDVVVDRDEHPRGDTTVEGSAPLRPIRSKVDADSTVTAGNASGQNDGAAMCVVTTRAARPTSAV